MEDEGVEEVQTTVVQAITVRLPKADYKQLRRMAFEHETSINSLILSAITAELEEHDGCGLCN